MVRGGVNTFCSHKRTWLDAFTLENVWFDHYSQSGKKTIHLGGGRSGKLIVIIKMKYLSRANQ